MVITIPFHGSFVKRRIFWFILIIGATGFEPATSRPPAVRATKLRHTPQAQYIIPELLTKSKLFFKFLFVVVCAPLSRSTEPNPNGKVWLEGFRTAICTGKVFHIKCDVSASAGNLLIFLSGCAAYRLLYKQTRTQCSNSVCKAIAMLANPAKICQRSAFRSGDICTLIMKVVNLCKWAVLLYWHCLLLGDSWTQLRPHIRPSVSFIKT